MTRRAKQMVVLVALLQGLLLYLADIGYDNGCWPFSALFGRICWYSLVLAVPSVLLLSIRRLDDRRFWQHMIGVLVVVSLLSWWTAYNAGGGPDLNSASVLIPFGISLSLGWFVLLPFLQLRQRHQRWMTPYSELFEQAWQNGLALVLAGLFTGLSWGVLHLWGALFKLIGIHAFADLFRSDPFEYLATGIMVGLGILIARTQERTLHAARRLVLAIFKLLLPLLALVLALFVLTLPFTGLEKLWTSFSAAGLLMSMLVLMLVFVNAVYQDGEQERPYTRWVRWLADAALLLAPVVAALAVYAIWLRVGQYGWTAERVWAMLAALVLAAHVIGYAIAVTRRHGTWLAPIGRINTVMALIVIALVVLCNSPTLDVHRISVNNQLARLADGRVSAAKFDLDMLRRKSGRQGYQALLQLADSKAAKDNPDFAKRIAQSIKHGGERRFLTESRRKSRTIDDVSELRNHLKLVAGHPQPDKSFYTYILAHAPEVLGCQLRSSDCVLISKDLDHDGAAEQLLCLLGMGLSRCFVYQQRGSGDWAMVGSYQWRQSDDKNRTAATKALRHGQLTAITPKWDRLQIGDSSAAMSESRP